MPRPNRRRPAVYSGSSSGIGGIAIATLLVLLVFGFASGRIQMGEINIANLIDRALPPRAEQPWQPPIQPVGPLAEQPTIPPEPTLVPTRPPEPQRNEPQLVSEKVTSPGLGIGYKTSDGRFMSFVASKDGTVTQIGGELQVYMDADGTDPDAPVTVSDRAGNALFFVRVRYGTVTLKAFDGGFFDLD